METAPREALSFPTMTFVIAALAWIFVHFVIGVLDAVGLQRGYSVLSASASVPLIVGGIVLCLIVHESGHRIMGWSLGFRCVRFGFGPWEFYRSGDQWKRQHVKIVWGAFVRQVPSSFEGFRWKKAVTLSGGPLTSAIVGMALVAIALVSSNEAVFQVFNRLGVIVFLGVFELCPRLKNGIGSDGYRLWEVLWGGAPVDTMQREILAEASNFTPLRHRDWPHALIERLAASNDAYNLYLAYLHSLDAGDDQSASGFMRRLMAQLPDENPHPYYAGEAAYWLAAYDGRPEAARDWLHRAGAALEPGLRLRAESAIARLEGEPDRAELLAKEALARIPAPARYGSDQYELDRLNHLLTPALTPAS